MTTMAEVLRSIGHLKKKDLYYSIISPHMIQSDPRIRLSIYNYNYRRLYLIMKYIVIN